MTLVTFVDGNNLPADDLNQSFLAVQTATPYDYFGTGEDLVGTISGATSLDGLHQYTNLTLSGGTTYDITVGAKGWLIVRVDVTLEVASNTVVTVNGNGKAPVIFTTGANTGGIATSTDGAPGQPGSGSFFGSGAGGASGGSSAYTEYSGYNGVAGVGIGGAFVLFVAKNVVINTGASLTINCNGTNGQTGGNGGGNNINNSGGDGSSGYTRSLASLGGKAQQSNLLFSTNDSTISDYEKDLIRKFSIPAMGGHGGVGGNGGGGDAVGINNGVSASRDKTPYTLCPFPVIAKGGDGGIGGGGGLGNSGWAGFGRTAGGGGGGGGSGGGGGGVALFLWLTETGAVTVSSGVSVSANYGTGGTAGSGGSARVSGGNGERGTAGSNGVSGWAEKISLS